MRVKELFLFIAISVLFTFCSSKTDKDLFEHGQKLLSEEKYEDAVVEFEKISDKFSNSELAPKALFECAKVYQGQVIKNINGKESLAKSVKTYKEIFKKYPNSKEAENSLFMAGFILANELGNLDGAKETYELYIKNFPEGSLVDDAKIELENLGKTPEQILKEKIKEETIDETSI